MSDENSAPVEPAVEPQAVEPQAVVTPVGQEDRLDFVLDKYRADGRSESESMQMQAQSYKELESKFGSFTGSPDEYEATLSDELVEAGVELDMDSPLMAAAQQFAKDSNMSQDGFNQLVGVYAESLVSDNMALESAKAEEMKSLGNNAQQRIDGINQWAEANLDEETIAGLQDAAQSASAVKAIEALINKTRNAPAAAENVQAAPAVSEGEVREMQFAVDDNGQRKINVDPDFKREYERKRDALYGTSENRQMIG